MDSARLLLVDDDVKFSRLLREYLEPLGYQVETVHNGAQGLEAARAGGHAAIIGGSLPKLC